MYTHMRHAVNGLQGSSLRQYGPWSENKLNRADGKFSELELYSIKTAFSLVENLWIDLSMGTTQVLIYSYCCLQNFRMILSLQVSSSHFRQVRTHLGEIGSALFEDIFQSVPLPSLVLLSP